MKENIRVCQRPHSVDNWSVQSRLPRAAMRALTSTCVGGAKSAPSRSEELGELPNRALSFRDRRRCQLLGRVVVVSAMIGWACNDWVGMGETKEATHFLV
jgi:hypothetical protein